jgi:hypothetical protein
MVQDEALVELAHPEYWNNRYASKRTGDEDDSYEWFRDFEKLRSFLIKHLPPPSDECHILHLGCGSSVILLF